MLDFWKNLSENFFSLKLIINSKHMWYLAFNFFKLVSSNIKISIPLLLKLPEIYLHWMLVVVAIVVVVVRNAYDANVWSINIKLLLKTYCNSFIKSIKWYLIVRFISNVLISTCWQVLGGKIVFNQNNNGILFTFYYISIKFKVLLIFTKCTGRNIQDLLWDYF